MKTYLSKEKINSIKSYLKQQLEPKTIEVIRELESKGIQLNYENTEKNRQIFWQYANEEVRKINPPASFFGVPECKDFKQLMDRAHYSEAGEIVKTHIEKHYKAEWKVITETFNPTNIQNVINGLCGFCRNNHIESMDLKEIVMIGIDDYMKRYEIQNVDKELTKKTDMIAEYIDKTYYNKRGEDAYNIYQLAIREYMITGEKQLLHNILNKDY